MPVDADAFATGTESADEEGVFCAAGGCTGAGFKAAVFGIAGLWLTFAAGKNLGFNVTWVG